MMKSKVTTKQGDKGTTRTLGGETVSKGHLAIECTGRLDALRAQTALLRLEIIERRPPGWEAHAAFLWWLLHVYFLMGAQINDPRDAHPEYRQGEAGAAHVAKIEAEQGRLEAALDLPRAFIVSAGNIAAAHADLTATVARALERELARLQEAIPEFRGGELLVLVNRVSDYYFILARSLEAGAHQPVDYGELNS